jgi:Insulinase (Peptidase family M16)
VRTPRLLTSRLFLVVAVVLCACGAAPPPRALVMRDVSFPLRDLRFPSGLRVIVEEDHRAPVVGVFLLVGSGSTSDPPGKEGLAHYVEHLAFRARPDGKTSIWGLLERAGAAQWNASTGLDYTLFWETGPKEALGPLVTLEGVRLLATVANVTPEVAAVEREVVRNELRQRNEIYRRSAASSSRACLPSCARVRRAARLRRASIRSRRSRPRPLRRVRWRATSKAWPRRSCGSAGRCRAASTPRATSTTSSRSSPGASSPAPSITIRTSAASRLISSPASRRRCSSAASRS